MKKSTKYFIIASSILVFLSCAKVKNKNIEVKKKKKINFNFRYLLTIISIILIILSSINVIIWFSDNKKAKELSEELEENIVEDVIKNELEVDFENLKLENSDTVAYLEVNNTDIKYAVVQSNDNSYYLKHSFDGSKNSAGWVFADYRNKFNGKDKNIVIYGHNMKNGSMFGTLKKVLREEWYTNEDNLYIPLCTEKENMMFKVFSVYQIEAEDYYVQTKFTSKSFYTFTSILKSRSIYDFGTEVNKNDTILTLSTCAGSGKRTVLHAKRIS